MAVMAYDAIDGQLLDEHPIKATGRARRQASVQRSQSVADQARLLWQVMLAYAREQQTPAEGGFYFEARIEDIAKPVFPGVKWDDSKHVSNFLRPILGYMASSGNARIISKIGTKRIPFHYRMWIRDEWSLKRGVYTSVDRGAAQNIPCACGKAFLTRAAFSQHKRSCVPYAEAAVRKAEVEAYAEASQRALDETDDGEDPAFEAIPGMEGVSRSDYLSAGRSRTPDLQRRVDSYESILRGLQRDWKVRTPESLANLFDTIDKIRL